MNIKICYKININNVILRKSEKYGFENKVEYHDVLN